MLDIPTIRTRFPALSKEQNGQPVVHFENPAGTQVPSEVIDAYISYLTCSNSNTGGAFRASRDTDELILEARRAMADFLGAGSPHEIIFGQNMTSLTFHLATAIGSSLSPGDEIVTTRLEHDANIAPWLDLERRGIVVRFIEIDTRDMTLDIESAHQVITDRTRLVAVGAASNAFGTINDVRAVADMAHGVGANVFVDAVHYAAHGPVDVTEMGADLLACSPYKFFGPHLGVLYGRYDLLAALPAQHVRPAGDTPPGSWETGTQSHEALAALLAAVSYLLSLDTAPAPGASRRERLIATMRTIQAYERTLSHRLIPGMCGIDGVRVYGITAESDFHRRAPTVSFTVDGIYPDALAEALAHRGIFSWTGDHYAIEPLRRLELDSTNRIGLVHYNTPGEIDRFLEALRGTIQTLR